MRNVLDRSPQLTEVLGVLPRLAFALVVTMLLAAVEGERQAA
jgi:hypothetical protein